MGEVPIVTISAQVFQIDHETKKKWLPLTQQPVPVSLYHDSSKNTYRIICIDENKVIINCFVKQKMKFVKTSQKFGQWVDSQAATVYGIGCKSEVELAKFADKFDKVKELVVSVADKADSPSLRSASQERSVPATSDTIQSNSDKPSNGWPPRKLVTLSDPGNHTTTPASTTKPFSTDLKCSNSKCTGVITLLRAENDRLKLELAQSSSKAKEWEAELQSLRNSNATLTTALEESRRSADEWQKQLRLYDEEIEVAQTKLANMDAYVAQLNEARERLKELERMGTLKEEELIKLKQQYNECKRADIQNQKLTSKLRDAESENFQLKNQVKELTSRVDQVHFTKRPNQQGLRKLQEEISHKINELYAMNDKLAEELETYLDA